MKVTIDIERYHRMFNLGIETWVPYESSWKRFQITLLLGVHMVTISFGSRKRYDETTKLLQGEPA